ncbi:hypothetical protein [Acaryochloris sp. CCMEE 5410]|uniref:hypothetical protein n=1 Tax=Acaryochloris sp. CCMEE 5410 TaxID=310037 RepID=UPI0002484A6C|nr:hypothetical protein [Acaryochloris sp. CCMEE 5410]KAI9129208.1 hypothetical protein ON05_035965 [Acaryochloris sp. CCMEE 5410]
MGISDTIQAFPKSKEPLIQLVRRAQNHALHSHEGHIALNQLASEILRSRRIGRPSNQAPLSGIYLEICDRIRAHLLIKLDARINTYTLDQPPIRKWASNLLLEASHDSVDDDLLKRIALEAQHHEPQTLERHHALTELVEAIRLSDRLIRPHRSKFSPQFYQLLYEEAVNQTLTYVCRRIETYDPHRGKSQKFMNWVNFRLDKVLIECRRTFSDYQTQELPNLNDLEQLSQPPEISSIANDVREYIAIDPEGIFSQTHIRHRPDASFQAIALARFDTSSWEEISEKFEIKIPTLSSFFQRCCQKFSPIFKDNFQ